jgi:hypothetical protein
VTVYIFLNRQIKVNDYALCITFLSCQYPHPLYPDTAFTYHRLKKKVRSYPSHVIIIHVHAVQLIYLYARMLLCYSIERTAFVFFQFTLYTDVVFSSSFPAGSYSSYSYSHTMQYSLLLACRRSFERNSHA